MRPILITPSPASPEQTARTRKAIGGFLLIELLALLVVVALLIGTHLPLFARTREKAYVTVDLSNVRQILRASALYTAENNDLMAHPTWGSDLTGPDGWAYLTSSRNNPVPGALSITPGSCAGRDINSTQFTNQLAFFTRGQITQYLPGVNTAWCPKDVATRTTGRLRLTWLSRPVKVTSYCWNATVAGYTGPKGQNANNRTYKISQFLPTDWQMWEQNENDGFYFNDAASNPEQAGETLSYRHSGLANWWTLRSGQRNIPGGGIVGTFGGSAELSNFQRQYDMSSQKIPAPNEILNGPAYQR